MKITENNIFKDGPKKEFSVADAVTKSLELSRDYYGNKTDNTIRITEELVIKFSTLVEILADNHVLDRHEIQKILGWGFDVEND